MTDNTFPMDEEILKRYRTQDQLCKITHNYNNFVQGKCTWIGIGYYNNKKYFKLSLKDINDKTIYCRSNGSNKNYFDILHTGHSYQISNYMLSYKNNLIFDDFTNFKRINALLKISNNKVCIIKNKRSAHTKLSHNNVNTNNLTPITKYFIPVITSTQQNQLNSYPTAMKHNRNRLKFTINTEINNNHTTLSHPCTTTNSVISNDDNKTVDNKQKTQIQTSILSYIKGRRHNY